VSPPSPRWPDFIGAPLWFSFREALMFLTIAVILIVLWALGFFVFPIGGGLIHLILVIAVIAIIWHFVKGRGATRL
jgi:hypothetical protein